ncbi:TrgA family protein [Mesobacterium sp. TK19101]|uniref:TrgA family protein n=1 Tax=Mesobacterium hydrothermale TaxID=3111907 RepID=A0ABU6HEA5_9RHOB|nr:TrgA family protein [Mesobacterium sp. TK19101]MEC3860200.1 TrgA family protein [Mesobacterium sp. TK19101]
MPTAARVVAGVLLAIVAFVASEAFKPLMHENTNFGYFSIVNAGIGLLVGWIVIGSRVGRGLTAGFNNGLTGAIALTFWCLFVHGSYKMVEDSFDRRFTDMLEAIASIFERMLEYGMIMLDVNVIAILLIGGVITGVLAEIASRLWK